MAPDCPERVLKFASLDIVPTHWVLTHITREWAEASYHWFFMARPYEFPERLLAGREKYYIRRKLDKPGIGTAGFAEAAMAEYIRCCTPENIHARAIAGARKLPCGQYPAEQAPEETFKELLAFLKD